MNSAKTPRTSLETRSENAHRQKSTSLHAPSRMGVSGSAFATSRSKEESVIRQSCRKVRATVPLPVTLLSMSSPSEGLRGQDSGHNIHKPLECRGHALTKSRVVEIESPERRSAGHWKASPGGRQFRDEPDPHPGDSAARQVPVDLAGDVALQDPDDVALGA